MTDDTDDPHAGQPVATAGPDPADADAAVLLFHGRGATARGMLELADRFDRPDVAVLAPQAADRTWYPRSFLEPIADNQPHLDSALATVERTLDRVREAGLDRDRVLLVGFSQGACLASEYAVRNPARYGGLAALSGGLIGPQGGLPDPGDRDGTLDGTPAFVGCSDRDPHIPIERVRETTATLRAMDAAVTERIYEGMGHTVNEDELRHVADLVDGLGRDGLGRE